MKSSKSLLLILGAHQLSLRIDVHHGHLLDVGERAEHARRARVYLDEVGAQLTNGSLGELLKVRLDVEACAHHGA